MTTQDTQRSSSGYTLLEVLIASALFVMVLTIGLSSFAVSTGLSGRSQREAEVVTAARAVSATVAGLVRDATGVRGANGAFTELPLELQTVSLVDGLPAAQGLRTVTFQPSATGGTTEIRTLTFVPVADRPELGTLTFETRRYAGRPQDDPTPEVTSAGLLPKGVALERASFRLTGVPHGGTQQAVIRLGLTAVLTEQNATTVRRSLQMTVTSRVLE